MVLHAGKMVFHKHIRCMLGYTSSRALRCERPTAVPHKPRPSTVYTEEALSSGGEVIR